MDELNDNLPTPSASKIADEAGHEMTFIGVDSPDKLAIATTATPASVGLVAPSRLNAKRALDDRGSELPHLIVLPGLGGDDLALVGLRRGLRAHARLSCIAYPDGRAIMRYQKPFSEIVDVAVDQIRGQLHGETGTVHLLGYSLGAFVAWEAARILSRSGIRVGSLALIDPIKSADGPLSRPALADGAREFAVWFASLVFHKLPIPCLVLIHWLVSKLKPGPRLRLLKFMTHHMRLRAFFEHPVAAHARTATHAHAATLYLSDTNADHCTELWASICPDIAVTRIGGDHLSIMQPPYRQSLTTVIARSLSTDDHAEAPYRSRAAA